MLANAKKQRARTERKLAEQQDENSDESEPEMDEPPETLDDLIDDSDDEENNEKNKFKKSKRKHQTQILEDTDGGNVHDFLSPTAAQSLTRNLPKKFNGKDLYHVTITYSL